MKHLKKFEELNYSTYTSAADKLAKHGQKSRSIDIMTHANEMEHKSIKSMTFDILVGETRTFNDAKFEKMMVSREKEAIGIAVIFKSDSNTHSVLSTLNKDGSVVWKESNKFANRISVNKFQKVLRVLAAFQPDFKKLLDEMGILPENIKVVPRTFYI